MKTKPALRCPCSSCPSPGRAARPPKLARDRRHQRRRHHEAHCADAEHRRRPDGGREHAAYERARERADVAAHRHRRVGPLQAVVGDEVGHAGARRRVERRLGEPCEHRQRDQKRGSVREHHPHREDGGDEVGYHHHPAAVVAVAERPCEGRDEAGAADHQEEGRSHPRGRVGARVDRHHERDPACLPARHRDGPADCEAANCRCRGGGHEGISRRAGRRGGCGAQPRAVQLRRLDATRRR